jgi:hypothetical protein
MKTILYYSSSREDAGFEEKIRNNIQEQCGDIPIISVTQKPVDFGKNICVGDVGLSYLNEWRQILLGAKEVKTEYIICAESDFLYPAEYFNFEPDGKDVYRYDNVYIVYKYKLRSYHRKGYSHGAQIVKRDFIIERYEKGLAGLPDWFDGRKVPWISHRQKRYICNYPFEYFHGDVPCVSFKTGDGINFNTGVMPDSLRRSLPYWGDVYKLREKYL